MAFFSGILKETICAVDIHTSAEGNTTFHVVHLVKSGDKIELFREPQRADNWDSVFSILDKKNPLVLSISGSGILNKCVSGLDKSSAELLKSSLPKAKPIDFYIQAFEWDGRTFFSLSRKSHIDQVLNRFIEEDYRVLSISLGISGLQSIALLNSASVVGWHTMVDLDKGLITPRNDNSAEHPNIKIEDLVVAPEYSPALSVAFKFFISPEESCAVLPEPLASQREDYQYSRKFKLAGITFLVALFIILAINFFVFQHYQKRNSALSQELVFKSQSYDELQAIEANIAKSQSMISELGIERNTSGTMILDQIAYQMPESILLESVFVRPPTDKIKRGKPLSFQTDKIEINGIANISEDLNNWLNSIRKMKLIKEVELVNFNRIEEPVGQFEIFIMLKE